MKLFFTVMLIAVVVLGACLIAGAERGSEAVSAEEVERLLTPELAEETEAAATVSVTRVSGGLYEVAKSNGVVLVYDGEPEDGALIGAHFDTAA